MARQLIIELVGRSDKLTKPLDDATAKTRTFGSKVQSVARKAGPAVAGIGAGFTALGVPLDEANAKLGVAISNSEKLTKQDVAGWQNENARAFQRSGLSISEQNDALANLINAGMDTEQVTRSMAAANELAAAKGISLEDAVDRIVKIMDGKGKRTLTEFGLSNLEGEEAVAALEERLRGTSAAIDETFSGKIKGNITILKDWAAQMGTRVGPAMTALGGIMMGLPAIMSAVTGAIKGVRVALTFLAAHPLLLGATVAIAGLVLLEQKFGILTDAFNILKDVGKRVIDIMLIPMKTQFNILRSIVEKLLGPLAKAIDLGGKVAGIVGGAAGKVGGFVGGLFHDGGVVPGPPGATIPILAQAGETVVPAGRRAGTTVVNINVSGVGMGRDFGRAVADVLRDNRLIGVT